MSSHKYCEIFKNSFFYRTPMLAAFMSTREGGREKGGYRSKEKLFK